MELVRKVRKSAWQNNYGQSCVKFRLQMCIEKVRSKSIFSFGWAKMRGSVTPHLRALATTGSLDVSRKPRECEHVLGRHVEIWGLALVYYYDL